ncbi:MAG: desulfoferrodoxin [Oscillospiraceae bacterium]|jgi:superoxide reductase|nr:desulfoferrodoxin [Oscillospiraceae bacterium]
MSIKRRFCRCDVCGNFVSFINDAGTDLVCCGKKMTQLTPNTADASHEKHVPVAARAGDKLTVTVGSVPHPMAEEHHIAWIVVVQDGRVQRTVHLPAEAPTADFTVGEGPVTVYAFCNLHGLWMGEF